MLVALVCMYLAQPDRGLSGYNDLAVTLALGAPAIALPFVLIGKGRPACLAIATPVLLLELLLIAYAWMLVPGTVTLLFAGVIGSASDQ